MDRIAPRLDISHSRAVAFSPVNVWLQGATTPDLLWSVGRLVACVRLVATIHGSLRAGVQSGLGSIASGMETAPSSPGDVASAS